MGRDSLVNMYTAISIYVVGSKPQAYKTRPNHVSKVFDGYTKTMKTTVKPRKGLVELLVSMGVLWVILGKALQSMFAE